MRLATTLIDGRPEPALVASDQSVVALRTLDPRLDRDLLAVIDDPDLRAILTDVAPGASGGSPLGEAHLLAPIPRPRRNVFCVGWNYDAHFAEGAAKRADPAREVPNHPTFFSKQPNTVVGTGTPVRFPMPLSEQLDWEVELAVVIGRSGMDIDEASALSYVFGYTVANDISVRDVQLKRHGGQWFKGKNMDTHCPLGPWITTTDDITDPQALGLRLLVNGVVKQDSSTAFMHFPIPTIIAELSAGMRLEPGDVILTGTPHGVGSARTPPEFLRPGDVVRAEVERLGYIENRIAMF